MKRNRIITTLLILCMSLLLAFGLTACGNKCEHTYFSDCDETCNECGETRETTAEHYYYGDCDSGCHRCFENREVTVEHNWKPATCTTGEACEGCGAVKSEPLGHSYTAAGYDDHYHYQECATCGEPNEESKVKHVLDDEYTCECGIEFTAQTENGAEVSILVKLYNSAEKLIKELRYANEELTGLSEYYYDENNNLTKKENYLADGTLDDYTLYEYDENGNETKREWFLGDGTPDGATVSEYNDDGDIIKETYTRADGYESISEYEYDGNGNTIKETYEDGDGYFYVYDWEYDENGNIIKETYEDSDGYFYVYDLEYNENGNKIKDAYEDSTGSFQVEEYEYDGNGNITKYSYELLNADNHLIGYIKYDVNGNRAEEWMKFADGSHLLLEYYDDGVTVKKKSHTGTDGIITVKDFDENENCVKTKWILPDGSIDIKEYDEDGDLIKRIHTDADGNTTVTEYDENGDIIGNE